MKDRLKKLIEYTKRFLSIEPVRRDPAEQELFFSVTSADQLQKIRFPKAGMVTWVGDFWSLIGGIFWVLPYLKKIHTSLFWLTVDPLLVHRLFYKHAANFMDRSFVVRCTKFSDIEKTMSCLDGTLLNSLILCEVPLEHRIDTVNFATEKNAFYLSNTYADLQRWLVQHNILFIWLLNTEELTKGNFFKNPVFLNLGLHSLSRYGVVLSDKSDCDECNKITWQKNKAYRIFPLDSFGVKNGPECQFESFV